MKIEKAKRPDGKKLLRKWTKMFPKIEGTLTAQTNKQKAHKIPGKMKGKGC